MFRNNVQSSINPQSNSTNDRITSQPIVSSSSTNLALLETIPEYRNLKKELALERQRCATWSNDYMKLRAEFENYRAISFRKYSCLFFYHQLMIFLIARPSVDGLNFLVQLVENLTASSTFIDSRSRSELATAIGLTEEQLTECCHFNPQRAALLVFSRLYPTYRDRAELGTMKEFSKKKSELLEDIFSKLNFLLTLNDLFV